jgi:hypothetical protein
MSPETALVTALCRTPLSAAADERIRTLIGGPVDWNAIETLASRWQIEPLVFRNLVLHYRWAMPDAVAGAFVLRAREARAHALTRTLILLDLVKKMESAKIPALVLKGPTVAIAAYGDVSFRTFADVDLLLHRDDLVAARKLMLDLGYRPDYPLGIEAGLIRDQHALEFSNGRTKVEIHCSLLSRHLRFDLDSREMWDNSKLIQCLSSEILALDHARLFLFLCAHGAKHQWALFRWVCDTAQLAARLDSAEVTDVLRLAERHHTRRLLSIAVRLAEDTFGEEYVGFPPDALVPNSDTRELVAFASKGLLPGSDSSPPAPGMLTRLHPYAARLTFWIRSRERLRDRVACVARLLFVPNASESTKGPMVWLLRPLRLAANAFRRAAPA